MATILIVDDDADFVQTTRLVLRQAGHEVISAPDGDSGVELAGTNPPALIIADVMMSTVLDGLDLARRLHDNPQTRDVPILMISSIASSPMAGMFPTDEYLPISAWLSKPVAPKDLIRQVTELLER